MPDVEAQNISGRLDELMGAGQPGPELPVTSSLSKATTLRAIIEKQLGLASSRTHEQRTSFLKDVLERTIESCRDRQTAKIEPRVLCAAIVLDMCPANDKQEIADSGIKTRLDAIKPDWVTSKHKQKGWLSRKYRLFVALCVAVDANVAGGWSETSARTARTDTFAPAMARALLSYLAENRDELRRVAAGHKYAYTLEDPGTGQPEIETQDPAVSTIVADVLTPVAAARQLMIDTSFPFYIMNVDETRAVRHDWRVVLDGGELTPSHARYQAIVPRRASIDDKEYAPGTILEDLRKYAGQTLFINGDAGDGKSAYLSELAGAASPHQVFVLWNPDSPYSHIQTSRFRQAIDEKLVKPVEWLLIVVYSITSTASGKLDRLLINGLHARASIGDRTVVLIDGRYPDFKNIELAPLSVRSVELLPLNKHEAMAWVKLLSKARNEEIKRLQSVQALDGQYPNLNRFLDDYTSEQQLKLLLDQEHPLIAKLILAVYGKDMRSRIGSELSRLKDHAADERAYLHVCLATAVDVGMSQRLLRRLASQADIEHRSDRDPWVFDGYTHRARHHVIAQVVLEYPRSRASFHDLIADYTRGLHDDPSHADAISRIIVGVRGLKSIGDSNLTNKARSNILRAIRSELLEEDNLVYAFIGAAKDEYDDLVRYADSFVDLVPRSVGGNVAANLRWLQVASDLFDAARTSPKCPSVEQVAIEGLRVERRKQEVLGENRVTEVHQLAATMAQYLDEQWFGRPHLGELFWVCANTIDKLPNNPVPPEIEGQTAELHEWMIACYHRLRALSEQNRVHDDQRRHYEENLMIYALSRLPAEVVGRLINYAWKISCAYDVPDLKIATLNAEEALNLKQVRRSERDERRLEAFDWLSIAAAKELWAAEPLFLMALLQEQMPELRTDNLLQRVDIAEQLNDEAHNRGFCAHARAILESRRSDKIDNLVQALKYYQSATTRGNEGLLQRISFAWDRACSQLVTLGNQKDAARYRRAYDDLREASRYKGR